MTSTTLVLVAAFIGVFALIMGVVSLLKGNKDAELEGRLQVLTGNSSANPNVAAEATLLNQPLDNVPNLVEKIMSKFPNLGIFLSQSGLEMSAGKFTALTLVSRALRAGHSLAAGISLVASEMKAPIAEEFTRCYEEQNLGVPLEEALEQMAERVPNMDLRFFVTAVILQRQTGGDLAEILDKIGHLVRERFKIWGAIAALTGEGRLSGIILLALPPVLFGVIYRLNKEYVMALFTDPLGKKMLLAGIVMQLLGAIVIRKIVNIKV